MQKKNKGRVFQIGDDWGTMRRWFERGWASNGSGLFEATNRLIVFLKLETRYIIVLILNAQKTCSGGRFLLKKLEKMNNQVLAFALFLLIVVCSAMCPNGCNGHGSCGGA